MPLEPEPALVAIHQRPLAELRLIDADTPQNLIARVRAAHDLKDVVVEPDQLALSADGDDVDSWIALASVLVVEGVRAFRTRHVVQARRILDAHLAIAAGEIGPE